jgi:CHAT domain-containing protein
MFSLRANSAVAVACFVALLAPALSSAQVNGTRSIKPQVQKGTGTAEQEILTLQPGSAPFERTLAGGQTHSYQITLEAGQYFHVVADQRGIDVVVRLFGPHGDRMAEIDSPNGVQGPEPLFWIAEKPGTYRLQVSSPSKDAGTGRYQLSTVVVRDAAAQDRDRVAAQQAFAEGVRLYSARGTKESLELGIRQFKEALAIWRSLGERSSEGQAAFCLGVTFHSLGDYQAALAYHRQAQDAFRTLNDPGEEAAVLDAIGLVYRDQGEPQKALDYLNQTLDLLQTLDQPGMEGNALYDIGLTYYDLGEGQRALDYFLRSLPLRRASGDRHQEAQSLTMIGRAHQMLNHKQMALDSFNRALRIRRALHDQRGEGTTLTGIGSVYFDLGEYRKALRFYYRSLILRHMAGDRRGESYTLSFIGDAYKKLGNFSKALEYYSRALPLRRDVGDRVGEAQTLAAMAVAQRNLGLLSEARARIEEALGIFESLRGNVVSPELRSSFLASVHGRYEFYIDLLMRFHQREPSAGYDRLALEAAQRFRARSFLELMAESKIDLRQDLTPDQRQHEAALLERISVIQKQLFKSNIAPEREQQLKKDLGTAEDDLERFGSELRETNPEYAAIHYPEPITLDRMQQELLDADTTLVEYVLGDDRSFAWAVSRSALNIALLPPRKQIERQVSLYRQGLMEKTSALTVQPALQRINVQSTQLYRTLLRPLESALGSSHKLIIVPDGLLSYLPFETLLIPDAVSGNSARRPVSTGYRKPLFLLQRFAISYSPSASALASVRTRARGAAGPAMSLLAFGDPLYHAENVNPAIVRPAGMPAQSYKERGLDLTQLPFTRAEVSAISSLFPPPQEKIYLGVDATEANVKAEKLDQYRYLHFAAHGYVDEESPARSGIVLSLTADPKEDGVLQTGEIMRLRLNADLVTLSACRTGLGRLVNGEGVVGLSRAFFYAGARSLVVSLWNVNDMATSELMASFYQNLNRGLPKDEALRQAKLTLMKAHRGGWRHPYFWAPFVLIGHATKQDEGW